MSFLPVVFISECSSMVALVINPSKYRLIQWWPNYGLLTSLTGPPNTSHIFWKHHVSYCGQQCNSTGCCLSRNPRYIWPSIGQAVANSALGSKSLATPRL